MRLEIIQRIHCASIVKRLSPRSDCLRNAAFRNTHAMFETARISIWIVVWQGTGNIRSSKERPPFVMDEHCFNFAQSPYTRALQADRASKCLYCLIRHLFCSQRDVKVSTYLILSASAIVKSPLFSIAVSDIIRMIFSIYLWACNA